MKTIKRTYFRESTCFYCQIICKQKKQILFYNTTYQNNEQVLAYKKNQGFSLNFGALNPNLFLIFFQHVRFLR
jgi:aldehyde:ferredoxin oxidoreductase